MKFTIENLMKSISNMGVLKNFHIEEIPGKQSKSKKRYRLFLPKENSKNVSSVNRFDELMNLEKRVKETFDVESVEYSKNKMLSSVGHVSIQLDGIVYDIALKIRKIHRGNEKEIIDYLNNEKPFVVINSKKTKIEQVDQSKAFTKGSGNAIPSSLADISILLSNGTTFIVSAKQEGGYNLFNHFSRLRLFNFIVTELGLDENYYYSFIEDCDDYYINNLINYEMQKKSFVLKENNVSDKIEIFRYFSNRRKGQKVDLTLIAPAIIQYPWELVFFNTTSDEYQKYLEDSEITYQIRTSGKPGNLNKFFEKEWKSPAEYNKEMAKEWKGGKIDPHKFPFWVSSSSMESMGLVLNIKYKKNSAIENIKSINKEILEKVYENNNMIMDRIRTKVGESIFQKSVSTKRDPVIIILGRFQPFTNGHLSVIKEASNTDKKCKVVVLVVKGEKSSLDREKNPFPYELQKEMIMNGSNGLVNDILKIPSAYVGEWIELLRNRNYEPVYWIAGSDRVNEYKKMVNGLKDLNVNIEMVESSPREFNPSGTLVRKTIRENDDEKLKQIVPPYVFKIRDKLKSYLESKKEIVELSTKEKNRLSRLMPKKFYHVSRYRLKVGDEILPGNETGKSWGSHAGKHVFMNNSPIPHYTIQSFIKQSNDPWHIYEVKPLGEVEFAPYGIDEYVTNKAKVVKYIGNAKGLLKLPQNLQNKIKKGDIDNLKWKDELLPGSEPNARRSKRTIGYTAGSERERKKKESNDLKGMNEMMHLFDLAPKGKEFVDNLLNKEALILQKLDGSSFGFRKTENGLVYFGREGKPISKTKRASIVLYEGIIDHLEHVFLLSHGMPFLPIGCEIWGEYFPNGLIPIVPIKKYPKNSWILYDVKIGGKSLPMKEIIEISKDLDVEEPAIMHFGSLSAQQKKELNEFIFSDEKQRLARFETGNFAQFILNLINPNFVCKINDEILEGIVFIFQDDKPISLKLVDPYFTQTIKQKKKEFGGNELKSYKEIIKKTTLNFLEKHLADVKEIAVMFSRIDDIETAFINVVNNIIETYANELKGYNNIFSQYEKTSKESDLGQLFQLNPKFVSKEIISLSDKYFYIGDIYKLIINHFLNPKRRASGMFTTEEIGRMNKIINAIQYILQVRS